jgi:ankyrin repeat protein
MQQGIQIAARLGFVKIVELLYEHGADLNASDKKKYTPLMLACLEDQQEVIELLCKHKADLDLINNVRQLTQNENTALHIAGMNGDLDNVCILLVNKANV